MDGAPVRHGGGLVGRCPGPRIAEDDPARRGVGDSGHLGGDQGPGVEPGRGDGPQERGCFDRVGRREEQGAPGGVGQGADLLAVRAQEYGRLCRQRVEAGQLTFGQCGGEFRGGAAVAVRGAQDPYPYAFGSEGPSSGCAGPRTGFTEVTTRGRYW